MKFISKIFMTFLLLGIIAVHAEESLLSIMEVQIELQRRGYDVGMVDGISGQNTSRALTEFQKVHNLEVTGLLNNETVNALRNSPDLKLQRLQAAALKKAAQTTLPRKTNQDDGIAWYWWLLGAWLLWRFFKRRKKSAGDQTTQHEIETEDLETQEEEDEDLYGVNISHPQHSSNQNYSYWASQGENFSEEQSPAKTPTEYKKDGDKCWVPKGQTVSVAGETISLGMLYVGKALKPQKRYQTHDSCLIHSRVKVAPKGSTYGDTYMPYWPSYSEISPYCRRQFLDWLAGGANDPNVYIGFVFLYFYGLERRLFLDQSEADREDIIAELRRLMATYGSNHSFSRYCGQALSYSELVTGGAIAAPPLSKPKRYNWELPLNVQIYIGNKLKISDRLTNDDLLIWFFHHPESRLRTPALRLEKEFIVLMQFRLSEAHPKGHKISKPKKNLEPFYEAASNTFAANLKGALENIPDISGLSSPIKKVQKIADQVMNELDPLSRFLGREPDAGTSIKAAQFLPGPLIEQFGSSELKNFRKRLTKLAQEQGGSLKVGELMESLTPGKGIKFTKSIHRTIEAVLKNLGWTLIPGPEEAMGTLENSDLVFITPQGPEVPLDLIKDHKYQLALLELALGAYIAHADGHVAETEIDTLLNQIEKNTKKLTKKQKSRLHTFVKWLTIQQPNFSAIRRNLKKADLELRHSFAQLALVAAGADGKIDHGEIKALEIIYRDLKLDTQALFSDLHAMAGGKTRGFSKSPKPSREAETDQTGWGGSAKGVVLDPALIKSTMTDTSRASKILSAIFEEEKETPEQPIAPTETLDEAEDNIFNGLPRKHTQLLKELLDRKEWKRKEYVQLASSLKLMPGGALEAINEWAFERFDQAIIEDDEPLLVNSDLIKPGD